MAPTKKQFSWDDVQLLHYITHIGNLRSIFEHGVLSHSEMDRRGIKAERIYNPEVVNRREGKQVNGKSLWEYANLYFQPRNPMLFQVLRRGGVNHDDEIVVLGIRASILQEHSALVTNGNAAADLTVVKSIGDAEKEIGALQKVFGQEYWNSTDGSKRTIMAEFLLPETIPAHYIASIFVSKTAMIDRVRSIVPSNVDVVAEPYMFFRPRVQTRLTNSLSLADGDLFFSNLQTLTVSVNTVGVMGKGLASRAKYQFPDVYVKYQDLCRRGGLKLGKPALYKRDFELANVESADVVDGKWFLLFPTKDHWRNDSKIEPIEEGLSWLVSRYEKEGIESLAIPALGCGLGNLDWADVGPIMCKYLAQMKIVCTVYLPQGKEINPEHLTRDYLLD